MQSERSKRSERSAGQSQPTAEHRRLMRAVCGVALGSDRRGAVGELGCSRIAVGAVGELGCSRMAVGAVGELGCSRMAVGAVGAVGCSRMAFGAVRELGCSRMAVGAGQSPAQCGQDISFESVPVVSESEPVPESEPTSASATWTVGTGQEHAAARLVARRSHTLARRGGCKS